MIQRRAFLAFITATLAPSSVVAVPLLERKEPVFDIKPPVLRSAKGRPLTAEEIDKNFQDLHDRLRRLEG